MAMEKKQKSDMTCVCWQVAEGRRFSVKFSDQARHYREGDTLGNSQIR